jgi:hypothetical protein
MEPTSMVVVIIHVDGLLGVLMGMITTQLNVVESVYTGV